MRHVPVKAVLGDRAKILHIVTPDSDEWAYYDERPISQILAGFYEVCGEGSPGKILVDQWWKFSFECEHANGVRIRAWADSKGIMDFHDAVENCLFVFEKAHAEGMAKGI